MIKNTTSLTELETTILEALFKSADGNGHDFGFIEDIEEYCNVDMKIARGVVSSLIKKDIITVHEKYNNYTQFTWNQVPHDVDPGKCVSRVLPEGITLHS